MCVSLTHQNLAQLLLSLVPLLQQLLQQITQCCALLHQNLLHTQHTHSCEVQPQHTHCEECQKTKTGTMLRLTITTISLFMLLNSFDYFHEHQHEQ